MLDNRIEICRQSLINLPKKTKNKKKNSINHNIFWLAEKPSMKNEIKNEKKKKKKKKKDWDKNHYIIFLPLMANSVQNVRITYILILILVSAHWLVEWSGKTKIATIKYYFGASFDV